MTRSIIVIICFFILTSCFSKRLVYLDIDADINFLKQKIQEIHPDPYWSMSEEEFDSLLNAIKSNTIGNRRISQKEFYQMLNPVVAQLNDGHTRMEVPVAVRYRAFFGGSRILPLALSVKDNELFIRADLRKEEIYNEGFKVLSINSIPVQELINQLLVNKYGYNQSFRVSQINDISFTRELWLFFDMNKQFELKVLTPEDKIEKMFFKGIYQPVYYRRLHKIEKSGIPVINEFAQILSEHGLYQETANKVAFLRYNKFKNDSKSFLDSAFTMAKTSGIEHLFFDLRGNSGGSSNLYETILSHITSDSIMIFSGVEYKVSNDLLNNQIFGSGFPYPGIAALGEIRTLDEKMMWVVPDSKENIFQGKFYVLMDRGTFSAASGFCTLVQDNKLGILIGEPSGGLGSDFGAYLTIKLPKSKIPVGISTSRFFRPNGDENFAPVVPDVEINCFGREVDKLYMKIGELLL